MRPVCHLFRLLVNKIKSGIPPDAIKCSRSALENFEMARTMKWKDPLEALEKAGRLPVEMFLTFRVNQLSNAFERQWSRYMRKKAGVSLSEWRILAMLQHGPSTFARLVEATDVNKALLHRSAHSLAKLELISITDTPGDARSTTLALTAQGAGLLDDVGPRALARQKHFLSVLTTHERETLYTALNKLRTAAQTWDEEGEEDKEDFAISKRTT
jgi:DNA-binding MarR family transcriptional regulator